MNSSTLGTEYGYIHWHSALTGKEGMCCNFPVANPAEEVSRLNKQLSAQEPLLFAEPQMCREYWFVPATGVYLPTKQAVSFC